MRYNPEIHHRRSIRLQGYDYSQAGVYFITVCAYNREYLFGGIDNGKMVLNEYGDIVMNEWQKTPEIRPNIKLDEFSVMPNHLHGIIVIDESRRGVLQYAPTIKQNAPMTRNTYTKQNAPMKQNTSTINNIPGSGINNEILLKSPSQTIGAIIRGIKSIITKKINLLRDTPGMPVWQRNYYEHIIQNENELNKIREYIQNNPMNWNSDMENKSNRLKKSIENDEIYNYKCIKYRDIMGLYRNGEGE